MSFTRRLKYGNVVAARKLKQKVTSEKVELFGFLSLSVVALLVMNVALSGM